MPEISRQPIARYGIAVAASLVACALRLGLDPWLRHVSPFMLFVPAVMLGAWYGGLGPGLLATAIGAAAADYFLLAPVGFSHTPENLSRVAVFVAVGVQISWLSAALHKARRRAEADARLARAAEQAARASEQRYRTLAANFPDGAVFLFDRDLRWLLADGKALAASGVSREQLEGKTLREVLPPDISGQIEPLYRAALADKPAAAEVEQNGRVYFVHAVPLRDADGTVPAGLCITLDVTDRVRVREALREARDELEQRVRERTAELHYQKTLLESQSEASLDGILVVSQAGRVAYANRRFVELWQLSDSPAGDSLESVSAAMRGRLPGGRDPLVEVSGPYPCPEGEAHEELRLTDGTVLECYSTSVRGGDGASHGRVWFFHDVTARKRAEAELDARLRQQAAVSVLGQHALAGHDLSALMDEAVTLVAQTLDVEYATVLELLPGGDELLLRAGVGWRPGLVGAATVGTGTDSQAGYTLRSEHPVIVEDLRAEPRFDGPPLLHEHGVTSGMSVVIQDGQVFGVLGTHTARRRVFTRDDVHFLQAVANVLAAAIYRRRAEETRAKLAAVVQASGEAIVGLSPDGVIQTWNPAAERMFGYAADEAVGRSYRMLIPADHLAEAKRLSGIVRGGGTVTDVETVRVRKGGHRLEVGLSLSPIRGPAGAVAGVAAVLLDITDRKRLERQVMDVCEREQRRIGQDLHDGLGQHLTGVGLLSQSLHQKLAARAADEARDAEQIARLVQQAVQQARDLARGLRPVALESDALVKSLEELAALERSLAGVHCDVCVDGPVAIPDDAVAMHLYRIAQEAVNNAVKHARARRVTIRLAWEPGAARLDVEDDGIGMPPALPKGRGMGLQIMRYRANMVGATFDVRAGPTGGTVVTCRLPLSNGGQNAHANQTESARPAAATPEG